MSAMYSSGIVDLIDKRWDSYDYTYDDVVEMVARIIRPSSRQSDTLTEDDIQSAKILISSCD